MGAPGISDGVGSRRAIYDYLMAECGYATFTGDLPLDVE